MDKIKVFLQYPWKFPDSPYYNYLVKYPPKNIEYLKNSEEAFVNVAKKFPHWTTIECVQNGKLRSIEDIKKEAFKKDPELKKAYDDLEVEYSIIAQVIQKRLDKGFSQKQLAEKIGTKQSAIARLESGNTNPSIGFLRKVASALGGKLQISI